MTLTLTLMSPLLIINFVLFFLVGPVKMSTLLLVTCSLPSLLFFWFLAKHRDGRFFFTFCFADTIVLEILYLTAVLDYFLGNTYIFTITSRFILCPILAWGIYKCLRPIYLDIQTRIQKGWYAFASIALIFYIALSLSMSVPTLITSRPDQLPAFILLLILMPLIYLHIFRTLQYQQYVYEMTEKDNILQLQITHMQSRIKDYSKAVERSKEERHNYRHQIQIIASLLEKEQYTELHNLIQEYHNIIPDAQVICYCKHPIIDAMFCSYLQMAEQEKIHVTTQLDFPEHLPVNEAGLATVLANAIENAILACMNLTQDKRHIKIKVLTNPCFMLQISNTFNGVIAFDKNNIPVSPLKDHGFGTRSIVTFCEKSNAFYEFKTENDIFFLRIIFK